MWFIDVTVVLTIWVLFVAGIVFYCVCGSLVIRLLWVWWLLVGFGLVYLGLCFVI